METLCKSNLVTVDFASSCVCKFTLSNLHIPQTAGKPSTTTAMPIRKHMHVAQQAVVDGFVVDWSAL